MIAHITAHINTNGSAEVDHHGKQEELATLFWAIFNNGPGMLTAAKAAIEIMEEENKI